MHELPEIIRKLSDPEWADLLAKSVECRTIEGVEFPNFPAEDTQLQFVGSSGAHTIREALSFYSLVKGYSTALGMPLGMQSRLLDFGCGWGRFLRFFWRDVDPANLIGVDVDPEIINLCRFNGLRGQLYAIDTWGSLPLPNNSVSHIIAYSVFTHLPEDVHLHWLSEIQRVAIRGCVFVATVEPRRFLDFITTIPKDTPSAWHRQLRQIADIETAMRRFESGEFVYLPTGGGNYRDASVYGDAVIPPSYLNRVWGTSFRLHEYIDDPLRFWQAIAICQKP